MRGLLQAMIGAVLERHDGEVGNVDAVLETLTCAWVAVSGMSYRQAAGHVELVWEQVATDWRSADELAHTAAAEVLWVDDVDAQIEECAEDAEEEQGGIAGFADKIGRLDAVAGAVYALAATHKKERDEVAMALCDAVAEQWLDREHNKHWRAKLAK